MHIDKIIAKQVLSIEKNNANYTKKYVNYYFHIVKIWWKRALYAYWFTGSGTFTDVYLAKWTAQLLKAPPISAQENWDKQKAWLKIFGNSRWFNQNAFAHLKEELEANKPASSDVQINVSPLNTDLNFNKNCITSELAFNSQILLFSLNHELLQVLVCELFPLFSLLLVLWSAPLLLDLLLEHHLLL